MGVSTSRPEKGIAVVTVDFPPVNALPVQGWYDLADAAARGRPRPEVRCVVLAAEGRGFNAGVDIKEMQRDTGHDALIGANRGCYEAFAAVYECEVPVVAAVHGFCLGGGIGLVGNADAIVASRRRHLRPARAGPGRARRGHPPGPAGPAAPDARDVLHLAHRRPPPSCTRYGSVLEVVPRDELRGRGPGAGRRDRRQGRLSDPAGQGAPSTASTRSTYAAATASSRASPSSPTSAASPTGHRDTLRATGEEDRA